MNLHNGGPDKDTENVCVEELTEEQIQTAVLEGKIGRKTVAMTWIIRFWRVRGALERAWIKLTRPFLRWCMLRDRQDKKTGVISMTRDEAERCGLIGEDDSSRYGLAGTSREDAALTAVLQAPGNVLGVGKADLSWAEMHDWLRKTKPPTST